MYPKDHLAKGIAVVPQTCFVLIPFAEPFSTVFSAIRQAMLERIGFASCERAKEHRGGGPIMTDILSGIARAEIIIADISTLNANVFYELGIAHCYKDAPAVLILTQSVDELPFDLRHLRCIVYDATDDGLAVLQQQIVDSISEVTPVGLRFWCQDGGRKAFPRRLPGPDKYLYDFELGPLTTGEKFVKFRLTVRRHGVDDSQVVSTADHGVPEGGAVEVPFLAWSLNVDHVEQDRAFFCLCRPANG